MEKSVEYMLVMEITPLNKRKFKGRMFVKESLPFKMTKLYILDKELEMARTYGVQAFDVLTVNIVNLQ